MRSERDRACQTAMKKAKERKRERNQKDKYPPEHLAHAGFREILPKTLSMIIENMEDFWLVQMALVPLRGVVSVICTRLARQQQPSSWRWGVAGIVVPLGAVVGLLCLPPRAKDLHKGLSYRCASPEG